MTTNKLSTISKGKYEAPQRILLYGQEGVGKTTFAAAAPAPVFVDLEEGTAHLDVERFPVPRTWEDLIALVEALTVEPHTYRTLVIDPVDQAEAMLWRFICERDRKPDIEAYGYGKGYQAAIDVWRTFIAALDRLRAQRQMHVILVAHSWVKLWKNPEGEDFDRYQLKLHERASALLKEKSDHVLFAAFETYGHKKDPKNKTEKAKGVSTGARVLRTRRTAAYDAKTRTRAPDELPLSWSDFWAWVREGVVDVTALRADVEKKAAALPDEKLRATAAEYLAKAGQDVGKLDQLSNWINAKTQSPEQQQ